MSALASALPYPASNAVTASDAARCADPTAIASGITAAGPTQLATAAAGPMHLATAAGRPVQPATAGGQAAGEAAATYDACRPHQHLDLLRVVQHVWGLDNRQL
jgi:hypothetical protein